MRFQSLLTTLLAAVTVVACQDVVGADGDLSGAEVNELAESMIAASFDASSQVAEADASVAEEGLALYQDPITSHTEFTVTRSCVLGGQVVLEGTRDREWDRATHTGFSDLSMTKTHQDCARPFRRTDAVVTLNGAPNIAVEAHHEWAGGHRYGLQTLSLDGAIDWATADGREGTCVVDLDVTFDPDTHTRTVVGQVCNRTIDATTTWSHQDS